MESNKERYYKFNITNCIKLADFNEVEKWVIRASHELSKDTLLSLAEEIFSEVYLKFETPIPEKILGYFGNYLESVELDKIKNKAVSEITTKRLSRLFDEFRFVEAREFYLRCREIITLDEYQSFLKYAKDRRSAILYKEIDLLLGEYKFELADKIFDENKEVLSKEKYEQQRSSFEKIFHAELWGEIESNLLSFNFEEADELFKEHKHMISEEDYFRERENALNDFNILQEEKRLEEELRRKEAERQEKIEYIKQWFKNSVKGKDGEAYFLDDQQVSAVLNDNKNTIVTARAGSGKTRTLVAKVVYLVAKRHVKPEDLLVFVFNSKASEDINKRLGEITVDGKKIFHNPQIATTFHSFARNIVYSLCGENEKYGEILIEDRSYFIQEIIKEIPKHKIYQFFRDESFQIKRNKFSSEEEYFQALRNSKYETLDGKIVKSEAEKIICDYLFERDIKYYYENEYYLNSAYSICNDWDKEKLYKLKNRFGQESIKPDFYLPEYDIPWEHWSIGGNENDSQIAEINKRGAIGDYDDYREKMLWKKWFYHKGWIDDNKSAGKYALKIKRMKSLVETVKYSETREAFESKIDDLLKRRGIDKPKLSEEELIEKVWNKQIKRFSKMIEQFIDRSQQQFFDDEETLVKKVDSFDGDARTRSFLEIGLECYKNYHNYLAGRASMKNLITKIFRNKREEILDFGRYGIDFNLLLKRTIEIVGSGQSAEAINMLKNKKYILIDEYQDFSKLFLRLVLSVRKICPKANLFVVGDDWQAINRFAGSDVEYFRRFSEYFSEDSCELAITTNYRSNRKIVENARVFMRNSLGEDGDFKSNSERDGEVRLVDPAEITIDYLGNKDDAYKNKMKVSDDRNPSKIAVQYLKAVAEIIYKNKDKEKIYILHRKNNTSFWFIDLDEFSRRLSSVMAEKNFLNKEEFQQKVEIRTMHTAKGLQADVVIILEADDGIIPMYHQDVHLFEIFGETEDVAISDQKKLFYVAITRAKEKLYILHKGEPLGRNGFIEFLEI